MHAVMRSYSGKGAKELFDVIEKNEAEVEKVILCVLKSSSVLFSRPNRLTSA